MADDNPMFNQEQILEFLQHVGGFSMAEEASLRGRARLRLPRTSRVR